MLSRPYAFGCILRLRTSSEFKPGHSVSDIHFNLSLLSRGYYVFFFMCSKYFLQYGHFFPDPQYENVQHIICCDSFATYAYDFDFTSATGFSRYPSISESQYTMIFFLAKCHWNLTTVSICIEISSKVHLDPMK